VSETSPADLAIAFRSFGRRLREALEPVEGDRSAVSSMINELDQVIAEASRSAGATGSSAEAVADALEARSPTTWDEATLDALRRSAMDAGRLLRAIAAAAEAAAES
jgi:hypothetical protein